MAPITEDASLGSLTKRDTEVNLPRATRVKNKTPAAVQITAAHILREARYGRQIRPPKQKITELANHTLKKDSSFGDLGGVTLVQKEAPRKVKTKRPLPDGGSNTVHHEEYIDSIFPDDEASLAPNLKILEAAYKWKKQKTDDKDDD